MLNRSVELAISETLGTEILATRSVSGGDINLAFKITTHDSALFVKTQSKSQGDAMFAGEYAGLLELASSKSVQVPTPIANGLSTDGTAFLLMTWHDESAPSQSSANKLGIQLAQMHRHTSPYFGFVSDNFIGSLPQQNQHMHSWSEFYSSMRIEPMLALCSDYLSSSDIRAWDKVKARLPELLSCEIASLLHGDLWGGNAMHTPDGPMIYDPAVYYGDRMVDIAMSKLFGGFSGSFYRAYFDAFPATAEEMERIELYQLYYLLVHLALFGQSYLGPVRRILNRYA